MFDVSGPFLKLAKVHIFHIFAQKKTQEGPSTQHSKEQNNTTNSNKRCCNTSLKNNVVTDCKPCASMMMGRRRDSDADVEVEGGDDSSHDDHDIDTGQINLTVNRIRV